MGVNITRSVCSHVGGDAAVVNLMETFALSGGPDAGPRVSKAGEKKTQIKIIWQQL
jgi:hypothetical protein